MLTISTSHIDKQSQGIAHSNWTGYPGTGRAVSGPDLHVALRWLQGEYYRITRRHPKVKSYR